jgi:hypothetical protein
LFGKVLVPRLLELFCRRYAAFGGRVEVLVSAGALLKAGVFEEPEISARRMWTVSGDGLSDHSVGLRDRRAARGARKGFM